jgi:hypothetical protein
MRNTYTILIGNSEENISLGLLSSGYRKALSKRIKTEEHEAEHLSPPCEVIKNV